MKKILAAVVLLMTATLVTAQVHVRGYTKKDGTYVAPHQRTAPNSTTLDNYSTKGNVNPYTGQPGTKDPAPDDEPSAYSPVSPTTLSQPRPALAPNPYQPDSSKPRSQETNRW